MRKRTICGLLLCVTLVFCLVLAPNVNAASDEEEILQVMSNWTNAFANADFQSWSSSWWNSPKTSSFAPPIGSAFLTQGYDEIMKNMKSVFEYPKGTYVCSMHNPQITMLGDNIALFNAYLIMTLNPPFVKKQTIEHQRISFVFQKTRRKWLIVHAHGSYLPTE